MYVEMLDVNSHKPPLDDLLVATNMRESTNPQDKVFSVLALARDGSVDKIDYRKHLSEVLIDAAHIMVGVRDSELEIPPGLQLQFLNSIEVPSDIPRVPSWVPDYKIHERFLCTRDKSRTDPTANPSILSVHASLNEARNVSILMFFTRLMLIALLIRNRYSSCAEGL